MDAETVVVGGMGMRGINLAVALAERDRLKEALFIDPQREPLGQWMDLTSRIGMTHLRSSSGWMLGQPETTHIEGDRIHLDTFLESTRTLAEQTGAFPAQHIPESVYRISRGDNRFVVTYGDGRGLHNRLTAKNIVYSTGLGIPSIPVSTTNGNVKLSNLRELGLAQHTSELRLDESYKGKHVLVIGGGQSGYQVASAIIARSGKVTIIQRRNPISSDLEIRPELTNPIFIGSFEAFSSELRYSMMREARANPVITRDLYDMRSKIKIHVGVAEQIHWTLTDSLQVTARVNRDSVEGVDQVVLATGYTYDFNRRRILSDGLAAEISSSGASLPTLNPQCAAAPGFYFTGRGAEYVLGPGGRNIGTAPVEARRIVAGIMGR